MVIDHWKFIEKKILNFKDVTYLILGINITYLILGISIF